MAVASAAVGTAKQIADCLFCRGRQAAAPARAGAAPRRRSPRSPRRRPPLGGQPRAGGQKASVPLRTSFLSPQRALAAALGTVPSVWRCVCGQWVLPSGTANAVPSGTDAANVAPFHDGVANATHKDARSDAANAVPGVQDGTANAVCAAVGGTAKTVLPNGNGLAALLMAADH